MSCARGGQKRVSDALEWELQGLRAAMRVLGIEPGSSGRVASVLSSLSHHPLFSPAVFLLFQFLDEVTGHAVCPRLAFSSLCEPLNLE